MNVLRYGVFVATGPFRFGRGTGQIERAYPSRGPLERMGRFPPHLAPSPASACQLLKTQEHRLALLLKQPQNLFVQRPIAACVLIEVGEIDRRLRASHGLGGPFRVEKAPRARMRQFSSSVRLPLSVNLQIS